MKDPVNVMNLTNQPPITKIVGSIGIDNIKLCNLYGNELLPVEEMTRAAQESDLVVNITSDKKTTITGEDFCFSYGFNATRPFVWLEISASTRNQQNITNISPEDVKKRVLEIQQYLLSRNLIPSGFHTDEIRVRKVEINRTIPLNVKFQNYERILELASGIALAHDPDASIIYVKKAATKKTETIYMQPKKKDKKIETKIYDKSAHLLSEFKYNTDCDYLRYEITVEEQPLTKTMMVGKRPKGAPRYFYLNNLTTEKLNLFYLSKISEFFYVFEEEMANRAKLTFVEMSNTMKLMLNSIFSTALRSSKEEVCGNLITMFAQNDTFLDYDDIFHALDCSSLDEILKRGLRNGFKYIRDEGDITGNCDKLLHQRARYNELKSKLLGDNKFTIDVYPNYILLVGNRNHIIANFTSGSDWKIDETVIQIAYPEDKPEYAYAFYFDTCENRYRVRHLSEQERQRYLPAA